MVKLLGMLLLMAACQSGEEPLVAKVGERTITLRDYERMAVKLLEGPFRHREKVDQQTKEELLETMLAKELLLLEARARGIDRDAEILSALDLKTDNLLVATLHDRQTVSGDPAGARGKVIRAYTDSLVAAKKLECSSGVMQLLAGGQREEVPDVSLCEWDGGSLSVAKYRQALQISGKKPPADGETLRRTVLGLAQYEMKAAEARRLGIDRESGIREQIARMKDELVVSRLRRQEVRDVAVGEEEMRAFFEENAAEYESRPIVRVQEILVQSEELAAELRRRVEAGEEMTPLADEYNTRQATQAYHGRMWVMRRDNYLLGALAPTAFDAEAGELHGPLKVPGGYSLFKVLERGKRPPLTYEQVRKEIEQALRMRSEERQLDAFIETLREKYAGSIEIFPDVLSKALRDYEPGHAGKNN